MNKLPEDLINFIYQSYTAGARLACLPEERQNQLLIKIAEALKKEGLWLSYRSDRAMQLAWALEMDILSEAESIVCERYESLRQAVIGVDVFSFNALQSNKT